MGATVHQPPQAQRGKPVIASADAGGSASACESARPVPPLSFVDVKDGYERWAPAYDDFPNPLLAREQRHIIPLLPNLSNGCALDLACGTGRWLLQLSARNARMTVGIDLSSAMLRVAGSKKELSGTLAQADCLNLPFPKSAFDFAICSFALAHIQDLRSAASEFARVMKPESDLFITDLHPEAYAWGWRTGFRDRQSAVQVHAVPHTVEDILRAFYCADLGCVTYVGLCLGKPERPIFAEAGRQRMFQAACRVPAVLFCHFKQLPGGAVFRKTL
jgi:malonyl-CoA O-methyltransferase